jgi:hypothetical protein
VPATGACNARSTSPRVAGRSSDQTLAIRVPKSPKSPKVSLGKEEGKFLKSTFLSVVLSDADL